MDNLLTRGDGWTASSKEEWISIPFRDNQGNQETAKDSSGADPGTFSPAALPAPGWKSMAAPELKAQAEPKISINTNSVIFGCVRLRQTTTRSVRVTNKGSADLIIRGVSILGGGQQNFRPKSTCSVLSPGNSSEIFIAFNPLSAGIKMGYLKISSNDPKEAVSQVYLRGSGQENG